MKTGIFAQFFGRHGKGDQLGQGLFAGLPADPAVFVRPVDDELRPALCQGKSARGKKVHARRRLGEAGEQRRFGKTQVLDRLVKIAPRRARSAGDPVSVGRDGKIVAHDALAAEHEGESDRCYRVMDFAVPAAAAAALDPGDLHGHG